MRYQGGGSGVLGIVGKAVTFDTGGISIKPAAKMHEMKFDKSGGCVAIEATAAIARLGLPVNVLTVVPATENMPSGHAIKPGDIITISNGKTVEVNNTDAEGRLILADALAYAVASGRRPDRRPRHADRRDHRRARIHLRGPLLQRRRSSPARSRRSATRPASSPGGFPSIPTTRS